MSGDLRSKSDIERTKTLGFGKFLFLTPTGVYELKTTVFKGENPKQLKIRLKTKEILKDKVKGFIKGLFKRKK